MINETFDRIMLNWWAPVSSAEAAKIEVGTYSACYKLSLLITLSVQAFRMAAEPFFFSTAQGQQPQRIYARVMKFFVITVCFMFLAVVLFLDIWKYFIQNETFWKGLKVVPILLLANMFHGIFWNSFFSTFMMKIAKRQNSTMPKPRFGQSPKSNRRKRAYTPYSSTHITM